MSQPSQKSKFIIAMTGAVIVVAATWSVRHPADASRPHSIARTPSSIRNPLRLETAKQNRLDQFANTEQIGKVSGSFAVSIHGEDGNGGVLEKMNEAATRVRLHGVVTAGRPLTAHEYSWILPTGYRATEGSLTGTVPDLQPGQTFEISMTVDRGQIPVQPIVLHVFKLVNSEARGQVAQFDIPDAKSTKEAAERVSRRPEADAKYVQ
ncbi:hypothetical protein BH10BDE1_BH10BDE1_20620 [soil metagenome]